MTFGFSVSPEEKQYILDLVRWSILRALANEGEGGPPAEHEVPPPPTPLLREHLGAFVTLKKHGALRGCIGYVVGDGPLYLTVARMAHAAAFEDPRFMPVVQDEYGELETEVSVLGPVTPCSDPEQVCVGRHGLIVRRAGQSGLLLPQVPVEWGWDRETFLEQTCRKAGLAPGAWRDPETELYWFEAVVF